MAIATQKIMKPGFIIVAAAFLILPGFNPPASADTLYLKNGRSIEGVITKEDADTVTLKVNFGAMKFSTDQITRIERSSPEGVKLIKQKWQEEKQREAAREREIAQRREHEPKQVEVGRESGHVVVETTLNGKVKADLILDTGASLILLSSRVADELGIDPDPKGGDVAEVVMADGRKALAKVVVLDSVRVQDSEIRSVGAVVLPKNENASLLGDGLLGMSFLKKFNFTIDQKNNKLTLEKL